MPGWAQGPAEPDGPASGCVQALIFVLRTTSTVGSIMDHEYLDERFPHQWVHSLVVVVITYLFYRSESNVPWVLLLAGSKNIAVFFLEQLYWNRTGEKLKWLNVGTLPGRGLVQGWHGRG